MKKLIAIPVTLAMMVFVPVAKVFADTSDTVNLNVTESCTLTRLAYPSGGTGEDNSHKNGTGSWSGSTLSRTAPSGGTVEANVGSSRFNIICNSISSKKMTVATTSLVNQSASSYTIPNITDYSASKSGWAPAYGSTKLTNGSTVYTITTQTAGIPIEIVYGIGVTAIQAAGTYSGTATYSITSI